MFGVANTSESASMNCVCPSRKQIISAPSLLHFVIADSKIKRTPSFARRHRGGGPLHFAFTVTEETFDKVVGNVVGASFFTRGPIGERGSGRTLFIIDPDGNETEINTRYLYGLPQR